MVLRQHLGTFGRRFDKEEHPQVKKKIIIIIHWNKCYDNLRSGSRILLKWLQLIALNISCTRGPMIWYSYHYILNQKISSKGLL